MFCPSCKTEYRPGFTICADCGDKLVDKLPLSAPAQTASQETQDKEPNENAPLELLWEGYDVRFFNLLSLALKGAEILFDDAGSQSRIIYAISHKPYEIWIQTKDHSAAYRILENISGGPTLGEQVERQAHDQADALAGIQAGSSESGDDATDDSLATFGLEEPAAEVWSGEEKAMAEMLRACLRENGIGCDIRQDGDSRLRLVVRPPKAERARQIVREVEESSPPL